MTRQLNIEVEDFHSFARLICQKAVQEELSLVARDEETGELLGFCISEDFGTGPLPEMDSVSPKFGPIFSILDCLGQWFRERNQVSAGEYLHVFMMGLSSKCRDPDVSYSIVKRNLNIARERGYKGVVAETTSTLATRLAERNGFKDLHEIYYRDFEFNGHKVFADLHPRAKCRLMYQPL